MNKSPIKILYVFCKIIISAADRFHGTHDFGNQCKKNNLVSSVST